MHQASRIFSKWSAYFLLALLSALLQLMIFPRLPGSIPQTALVAAILIGMFNGVPGGVIMGCVIGLLCDAMIPRVEAYHTLMMMAAGGGAGFLCTKYMNKNLWTALLQTASATTVFGFFFFLFFILPVGRGDWISLYHITLPQIIITTLSVPPLYLLFRGVHRWFGEERSTE